MAEPAHEAPADDGSLAALGPLLDRLEELLADVEGLDEQVRDRVFELLDGVDAVHRLAITRLADGLGEQLRPLRRQDVAVDWLFEAYGVGVDDVEAASAAVEAAGCELLGEITRVEEVAYAYRRFRGPDGRVYSLNEQN